MIPSGGYVVDTLDAALWCLLNYQGYRQTVLAAVNLGGDTDTTAAVCGGLAGMAYSVGEDTDTDGIPSQWIESIANPSLIEDICERLSESLDMTKACPDESGLVAEGFDGFTINMYQHSNLSSEEG